MAGEPVKTPGTAPRPKKRKTVEERMRIVQGKTSLKRGEHLEDLVLYRNATYTTQKIQNDLGEWVTLLPKQYTEKSVAMKERNRDYKLEPFEGGTMILSRKRGIPLITSGVLEEIEVVEKAEPDDFE